MKWVEQRRLWRPDDHPDGPQRGDCEAACLASVFGVSYEETEHVDGTYQSVASWTRERYPGLRTVTQMLGDTWATAETLESWREWPPEHSEPGYWIATVWSPRIPDVEVTGCGCTDQVPGGDPDCRWCHGKPEERSMGIGWGLHAVVMRNGECVWDPHPLRDEGFGPFRAATYWRVEDPSLLSPVGACTGRERL